MADLKRLYWDTSVFLCFLSEEEEEKREICEDILQHAKDGQIELITSMYTMVEVIRPKAIRWPAQLTETQVALLEGMFRWPWIKKIQVHEELARSAARLAREVGLKPADSIHAATAIWEKADELQCWDYDFGKVANKLAVTEPTYLSDTPLIRVAARIGPTPDDFQPPTSPASSDSAQPSGQSRGVGQEKAQPFAPVPLAIPPSAQASQPLDSSDAAPPPVQSKK
jgi:predicted nucleic acid-binding protein